MPRATPTSSCSWTTAAATVRSLVLKEAAAARPDRVRVLELARNFGQHQAILAAFENVSGDVVVTLDADLQNPPEEIPKLLAKIAEGYDVVGGVRQNRQDSWPAPGRVGPGQPRHGDDHPDADHRLRLHAARLLARRDRGDQPLRRVFDLHPGARPELRAAADRDPGRARAAAARRVGVLAVPPHPAELRPDDRVLARAPAGVRPARHARRLRRVLLRPLSLRPPPDSRRRGRGRLHPVRDPLHAARHRDGRPRPGRRVRRAASTSRSAAARASASATCTAWAPGKPGTPHPASRVRDPERHDPHRRLRVFRHRARLPEAPARAGGARRPGGDAPRRARREGLVPERRGAFARARDRARRHGKSAGPAVDRARALGQGGPAAVVLLPAPASRGNAPGAAARRLEHARVALAEVPRPRPGQLGGAEGGDRNGRDAPRHDRARRPRSRSSTRRPSRSGRTTPPSRCSGASRRRRSRSSRAGSKT